MYNEKYGDTLGIIDDDFNKEQMYRIYYFIKNNCDDKDIQDRIKMINLDKPKTLEQQLTKLEGEHNKVIPSNNEFKEFTFDEELSTDTVKYVNINTLTPKTRYKVSDNDSTIRQLSIYYRIPNSTDKINLINVVSTVQQYEFYCNTLGKTAANIFVRSYIYSSVSYRITLGNTLDACSVEKVPHLLSTTNSFEFTPREEYHPTNKKYVDDNVKTAINGVKTDLGTEELTTNAKNLKGAVNELNSQYKDIEKKQKISITDFGVLGNGGDETNLIKDAILQSSGKVLYFPAGVYGINNTLTINNEVSLELDANAKIIALTPMDVMIEWGKYNVYSEHHFIKGGIIDGMNKAKILINLSWFRHFTLKDTIFFKFNRKRYST
jgi:hypothetical protein